MVTLAVSDCQQLNGYQLTQIRSTPWVVDADATLTATVDTRQQNITAVRKNRGLTPEF